MRFVVPGLLGACLCAAVLLFGAVTLPHFTVVAGIAGLLAIIWAGKLFLARTALWKPSPIHWPVLGFVVYAFVHYFLSPYEYQARMELFHVSLYGLVYFFAANNINRGRDRTVVIGILLVLGTLEAMYGIWQAYTRADSVLNVLRPNNFNLRGSGTYICPNHLAGLLEMILGFGLARLILHRPPERDSIETQVISKVTVAYAVIALLAGILLTLSRAGWAATAIGLLIFLTWGGFRTRAAWGRVAGGLAAICALGVLFFSLPHAKEYLKLNLSPRVENSSLALRDTTFNSRTMLWGATWKMIQDYPVFGSGAGSWRWVHQKYRDPRMQLTADYAHNDILQMISDYGAIGLALVAWAVGAFFWQARRLTRHGVTSEHRYFAVGAVLAVSILLVHSWFDFNLHIPANGLLFCTILGLVAGMEIPGDRYNARPLKPAFRYALGCGLVLIVGLGMYFLVPAARAVRYADRGTLERSTLNWTKAIEYYEKALQLDPKYLRPRIQIGDIYMRLARFRVAEDKQAERLGFARAAIDQYEAAFELNRVRSDVLVKMGAAYEMAGELEKAERASRRAVEVDPNSYSAHSQLALFLRRQGQEAEALRAFEMVSKLYHNPFAVWNIIDLQESVGAD
jgi:O-antigen ligase